METVFMYTEYRRYLKDKYNELKGTQTSFSYRYFSKRAGFTSPNFLKLVIDGKRNLSTESIYKFAEVLKLGKKEKRFFELLVHYDQAVDSQQRQHYYLQLLEFPEYRKVHHLEKEQYEYLAHWYYPAILELVSLPHFQEDPNWIVEQLQNQISIKEAKEAIDSLLILGLLGRGAQKNLVPTHQALTTGEEARSLAAFSFHEQILDGAKEALTQQEPEIREFAAITMAINEKQRNTLKEMIRDFRKMVLNYLSQDEGNPTAVYQFSAQFFSLTTVKKEKKDVS